MAQFTVKRVRGAVNELEADDDDIEDIEDQEAADDCDPSRDAADDLEIEQVARTVALTHWVPAADARMAKDAVTKVRHILYITPCTNYTATDN